MHQLFTAFAFLAVLITPTILAAHASGVSLRQEPKRSHTKGFIRLFENPTK